jgi:adenosylmethionine-8-amino-7-oxononanoate aminotransferase
MLSNIWHPFTQMATAPEPLRVVRGDGVWLELEDGRKIIDAISSWWVNLHGHARPEIADAIYKQASELEHVIFAGYTHDPALKLADLLVDALPGDLSKVFFSDNGSTAVEVAIKMAIQASYNKGSPRNRIVAFDGAYHGDTFGAMAAGERSVFSEPFDGLLFEVDRLPYPDTWNGDSNRAVKEAMALEIMRDYMRQYADQLALVLVEPLVQGAGGMRMVQSSFLQGVALLCKEYGVLLGLDEVMTGFGRTGELFACIKAGIEPDLVCLSKGITGGFMPLAVTVATSSMYDAFHSVDPAKALYHGHSYTANPLGCAAALASWKILNDEARYLNFDQRYKPFIKGLAKIERVQHIRVCGSILAFDVKSPKGGYFDDIGPVLKRQFAKGRALLRPLGNTIYIMPPYVITDDELSVVFEEIAEALT